MSDELTVSGSLRFSKGGVKVTFNPDTQEIDVSGDQALHHVQSVGTSEEALNKGDLGSVGWFMALNRDDTNYVVIHETGGSGLVKLSAGEFAGPFRLANDPYATADTAACLVEYVLIEA